MEDTIFAKIIRRETPADIVYEDEHTLAFLDVKPINRGHTLVVPKKFVHNIFDADEETLSAVMRTAQKTAIALRETLDADGVNIGINNETAAGQVVFHFHVHVIPRFINDGYKHWQGAAYPPGESEKIASKLRAKLG
ncbi:MAG: HIT family protein [bacterium]|nr:HIT family protein [bacterium]